MESSKACPQMKHQFFCTQFEKAEISFFKKSASCFKQSNSWFVNNGFFYKLEKFAWNKEIYTSHNFRWSFKEKGFLLQEKICLGRFLASKKWPI